MMQDGSNLVVLCVTKREPVYRHFLSLKLRRGCHGSQ